MSDENHSRSHDSRVSIPIPLPQEQVFRYKAADDILELLFKNPHQEFTVTQLREATGHGGKSVDNAIQILSSLKLVSTEKEGRRSIVRINQGQITKPDDPILEIPQEEFREPVRELLQRIKLNHSDGLVGVILFGSVARGEADRSSDIDIQVIVEGGSLSARRKLQDLRQTIQNKRFNGDRYEIQLLVESADSVENYSDKLQEIFREGIVLHSTEKLNELKKVVLSGK